MVTCLRVIGVSVCCVSLLCRACVVAVVCASLRVSVRDALCVCTRVCGIFGEPNPLAGCVCCPAVGEPPPPRCPQAFLALSGRSPAPPPLFVPNPGPSLPLALPLPAAAWQAVTPGTLRLGLSGPPRICALPGPGLSPRPCLAAPPEGLWRLLPICTERWALGTVDAQGTPDGVTGDRVTEAGPAGEVGGEPRELAQGSGVGPGGRRGGKQGGEICGAQRASLTHH